MCHIILIFYFSRYDRWYSSGCCINSLHVCVILWSIDITQKLKKKTLMALLAYFGHIYVSIWRYWDKYEHFNNNSKLLLVFKTRFNRMSIFIAYKETRIYNRLFILSYILTHVWIKYFIKNQNFLISNFIKYQLIKQKYLDFHFVVCSGLISWTVSLM